MIKLKEVGGSSSEGVRVLESFEKLQFGVLDFWCSVDIPRGIGGVYGGLEMGVR
jgi:hypothetical protein